VTLQGEVKGGGKAFSKVTKGLGNGAHQRRRKGPMQVHWRVAWTLVHLGRAVPEQKGGKVSFKRSGQQCVVGGERALSMRAEECWVGFKVMGMTQTESMEPTYRQLSHARTIRTVHKCVVTP
jgi:hypothetical protein